MAYFVTAAAIGAGWVTDIRDALDAGSGPALAKFYSGTQPVSGGALSGNTLLGTTTLSDPCGTISGRTLTIPAPASDSAADADGTATFVRFTDSTGAFVMDIPVMSAAAWSALSADQKAAQGLVVTLNTTVIVSGGPISWTASIVITEPNG